MPAAGGLPGGAERSCLVYDADDMYQQSMSIGYMIRDIHSMLIGADESQMQYLLFRLK